VARAAAQDGTSESLRSFFVDDEIEQLDAARKLVRVDQATVVYCVYENPFAKSGGIFAVADNYCSTLQEEGRKTLVVTPYHSKLGTAPISDARSQPRPAMLRSIRAKSLRERILARR